jgi:hypothetical protein
MRCGTRVGKIERTCGDHTRVVAFAVGPDDNLHSSYSSRVQGTSTLNAPLTRHVEPRVNLGGSNGRAAHPLVARWCGPHERQCLLWMSDSK